MLLTATVVLAHFLAVPNQALRVQAIAPSRASVSHSDATAVAAIGVDADAGTSETPATAPAGSDATSSPSDAPVFARIAPAPAVEPGPAVVPIILAPTNPEGEAEHYWEQRQKKIWMGLAITQSAAATFDAWSTRSVLSTGAGQELNPLLRPFAGNASLYTVIQVVPAGLDYLGHRMITSHHAWARHMWWLPQTLGTAASLAAGASNLAVVNAR